MSVNKIKIIRPTTDNYVDIPIEMKWDFAGHDDSISEYQEEMVKEIIGSPNDFEISRFSHNSDIDGNTDINYEFYFYDNVSPITATTVTQTNWGISYINEGFTNEEVYYYSKPFTKSFFKLDFYDTTDEKTQQIYFTIILPVQQGEFMSVSLNALLPNVDIRKPKFKLDYIGDKEGFFIYWLRDRNFYDINKFYMSSKFFDAKLGVYVVMTNTPQPLINPNKFNFLPQDYFYYKVNLDYNNKTYEVSSTSTTLRVGEALTPIKWYEYVNP
jgi:hypothetical protein